MGFIANRLKKRWETHPGGPRATVMAMASAYGRFADENPEADRTEILRLCLDQRAELTPGMKKGDLTATNSFANLCIQVHLLANPGMMEELNKGGMMETFVEVARDAAIECGVPDPFLSAQDLANDPAAGKG